MSNITQEIAEFYANLDLSVVDNLDDIYSDNVIFVDPVTSHKGITALDLYFRNLLSNVNYCRFDINQTISSDQQLCLIWTMHFAHPKVANGNALTLDGVSHIHIANNKIVFQQDFYDLGAMLYEHVPLIGKIIRWLKQRLA